jgi:ribosomal protein S18 acetylase RimI-like enzyme
MKLEAPFRPATRADSHRIAELFRICSGGVADYVWSTMADEYPGLSLTEIGARRYAREDIPFSYRNCVVAEVGGEVVGMLVAFPIAVPAPDARRDAAAPAEGRAPDRPDVLAPYGELEVPGSYYVCGMAVLLEHRNRGLGTRLLAIARAEARARGMETLSLLAFEQNQGAVRLYERNGFVVVDRRPVVPHELIHYTGDALLMVAHA